MMMSGRAMLIQGGCVALSTLFRKTKRRNERCMYRRKFVWPCPHSSGRGCSQQQQRPPCLGQVAAVSIGEQANGARDAHRPGSDVCLRAVGVAIRGRVGIGEAFDIQVDAFVRGAMDRAVDPWVDLQGAAVFAAPAGGASLAAYVGGRASGEAGLVVDVGIGQPERRTPQLTDALANRPPFRISPWDAEVRVGMNRTTSDTHTRLQRFWEQLRQ